MKPTVYIETSVISYLVARPSRDVVVAAYQEVTRECQKDFISSPCAPLVICAPNELLEFDHGDDST